MPDVPAGYRLHGRECAVSSMTATDLRAVLRTVTPHVNRALAHLGDEDRVASAADVQVMLQQVADRIRDAPVGHVFGPLDPYWVTDGRWTEQQLAVAAGVTVVHAAAMAADVGRAVNDAAALIVALHLHSLEEGNGDD